MRHETLMLQEKINCAILDVRLDGHTSLPLADELIASGFPVILASGYDGDQLPNRSADTAKLRKPFSVHELTRVLERIFQTGFISHVKPALTPDDEEHMIVYIRLLDAEADGADWMEAALLLLEIDPILEPKRARNAWQSHLSRAKWMIENGYQHLLRRGVH
jgi:hypothetical protein